MPSSFEQILVVGDRASASVGCSGISSPRLLQAFETRRQPSVGLLEGEIDICLQAGHRASLDHVGRARREDA